MYKWCMPFMEARGIVRVKLIIICIFLGNNIAMLIPGGEYPLL